MARHRDPWILEVGVRDYRQKAASAGLTPLAVSLCVDGLPARVSPAHEASKDGHRLVEAVGQSWADVRH